MTFILQQILALSEDHLKKESQENLSLIFGFACTFYRARKDSKKLQRFYVCWKDYTLKLFHSTSLVLKLSAWDQVNDLIREAMLTRPPAKSYRVFNAGASEVNGIYELLRQDKDGIDNPWYQKQPSSPTEPVFTLFRCVMRNKAKHWFISVVDKLKPGSSEDIDYYTHKSLLEEEREPQLSGWHKCGAKGVDPCPLLERVGYLLPPGESEADLLVESLPQWISKADVLTSIFGPSIHRELVARSTRLIKFMAEIKALTSAHVLLLWKAVLANEGEVLDELLSLVAAVSMVLQEDLYAYLVTLVQEPLNDGGSDASAITKSITFLEKCQKEYFAKLSSFPDTSASKLLTLVWKVYTSAHFDLVKNQGAIQELLSQCLNTRSGVKMASSYISTCLNELSLNSESTDEVLISKLVNTLNFLLTKHGSQDLMSVPNYSSFPDVLYREIKRFLAHNRGKLQMVEKEAESFFNEELSRRLHLLRQHYSLSIGSRVSIEGLVALFDLCSGPVEFEEFFRFLKSLSFRASLGGEIVCDASQTEDIFRVIICSPSLTWEHCGDTSVDCFQSFFFAVCSRQNAGARRQHTPLSALGLSTLWRMVQNVSTSTAAEAATDMLIRTYNEFESNRAVILNDIFKCLEQDVVLAESQQPQQPLLLPNQLLHLERLVDLIILCLVQREGLSLPPHATCGTMHRIQISVSHRRVSQYYNYNSAVDSKSDKPSEGKLILEVHPFHTVYTLKKKVATVLDFSNLKKLSLEFNGRALVDNHQFLAQLGVSDGSELLAVLMVSTFIHSLEDDDVEEQRCPEDNDVAVAIAADSDRFDLLVRALHCAQGSPYGQQAAQSLWKLLGMIPTQAKLLDQVRTMNNNLVWFTSLLESDLVRYTYALQIIDAILQPAPEYTNEDMVRFSVEFRRFFVKGGGFAATLKDFIQPPTSHILSKIGKSIGLHILRFLLLSSPSFEQSLVDEIFEEVRRNSSAITQALLSIACDAADSEDIESIQNSLMTITYLLQASEVAAQLTTNLQTKVLLLSVLRSNSHRVRDIAADFAIKMGRSQSVVFGWLTSELSSLRGEDGISPELFRSLTSLVESVDSTADVTALIDVVSSKLTLFHTLPEASSELSQDLLLGYLTLLHSLTLNFFERVMVSPFGKSLVRSIFNEFLFVISSENKETSPLCRTPSARQAAYAILGVVIRSSRSAYIDVLEEMRKLTSSAASLMKNSWGCTVAADMKKNSVEFVGLKNQGGTCYMNSLLQQMFMNVNMREAIMRTKIKSSVRSTLWHYTDAELIGQSFYFEHANGAMRLGKITDFNSNSRCHRVLYPQSALDGTAAEEVYMKVREGRFGKETGRVRHVRQGAEVGEEDEKEENARRVLEQLQRCFCFMEFSKRRYFDPKPFVDACKTLNMSFNVYHQNDSAEFYDQLLDRLETAMKGSSASRNYWGEVVLKSVFGGKTVYQKIPKECDVYVHEKQECGQGKGAREEPFLKIELMIRGHEQILDSLDELIQGELMDGDNKIMCDVCAQKKAVIRRTCFGNLPNMLVLHLKRFDLDFNTFETVKLNTRMAFSGSLNMMKYSREGFDEEEAKRLQGERRKAISPGGNESPMDIELPALDPMDYEYELSGILVHAGVAQGGHYYSFIKQPDGPKWFRFEDEDVTAFNPEAIPYQCFGGSFPANTIGGNNMHEDDRTSNALLLFYRKVHPAEVSQDIWASPSSSKIGSLAFVDGYDAFTAEVKEANEKHALMSYMLDAGLQPLMRDLVSIAAGGAGMEGLQWTPIETDVNLLNNVVELGCQFLLDVVLHFKERSGMQLWIAVLRTAFASRPSAAWNIVRGIAGKVNGCVWLGEYLFCSDALSRVTFGELLTEAIAAVAPKDPDALLKFCKRGGGDLDAIILGKSADALPAACFFILGQIITVLHDAPSRLRSHDELLIIIREFALIPSMCKAMLSMNLLEDLVYFVMPTRVSDSIRSRFRVSANARHDQVAFATVQNVFEALAALLGVPQKRKVNILDEKSSYWDPEFIPEAKAAFQTIFEELASGGTSIDGRTFLNFYEKVYGNGQRNLALIVRGIFERQDTSGDGKLTLTGFVRYHAELAVSNPKQVWKVITRQKYQTL